MVEKYSDATNTKKAIFKVVQHVADVLESLMDETQEDDNSIFCSPKDSRQKLRVFVLDLFLKLEMELSSMILALSYIDIFNTKFPLNKSNIHYITAIAMEISYKYNEDIIFDQESISMILKIKKRKLVELEVEFLNALDHELFLTTEVYEDYSSVLC